MNEQAMIDGWLRYLEGDATSPLTIKSYRHAISNFVAWYVAYYEDQHFDPSGVLPKDFVEWIRCMSAKQRAAPRSMNQRIAAVRKFFGWLRATGVIRSNPAKDVKFVELDSKAFQGLADEDYRKLMRVVYTSENLRDIAIIEAMGGAGLRISEVLALQVGDIFLYERETGKQISHIVVLEGKGNKRRSIPMAPSVKTAFTNLLASHPNRLDGDNQDKSAGLWVGQRGELKDPSAISRLLANYAEDAKFPKNQVHPHALRHSFAHRWLKKHPGDIRTLASILGHSDIKTTMLYTEMTDKEKAEKMAAMD